MRQTVPRNTAKLAALSGAILAMLGGLARADTPPQPAAAQPTLPESMPDLATPGLSPKTLPPKTLNVHRRASRHHSGHRHVARVYREPFDRPALGSVELLTPLPRPIEPPHVTVPVPAYPIEAAVAAYTTPPPPVVCHRVPRDPDAPDLHLRGEIPVVCEPDTP